ncbi:MAG: hydroxymethylglutaryl-CoA lyase [Phycisphaerales bacterium]|nr:hydroxymethylglutaryl-CoA lyase [Phycisphaerales bacterium]
MPDVRICEMVTRDGLQSLPADEPVALERRVALVAALLGAGLDFVEVGAFVSPRAVPQMADTDALCTRLRRPDGVDFAALVPNVKHYERFAPSRLNVAALILSASEAYSQFNTRMSVEESMRASAEVARTALRDGLKVRAHLSACFQDIDGSDSDIGLVVRLTRRLVEMGCAHVALADTKGTTHPRRVRAVLDAVRREVGLDRVGVHFHDSYGQGIANCFAALEAGVRLFDTSVGGIGGTPFRGAAKDQPGGGGNVATEELVWLLDHHGMSTGLDLDALIESAGMVAEIVRDCGYPRLPSKLVR